MSILKDDGEDQALELSYAEPEVAQDASPAPISSSAPPEESSSATPAPMVALTVPVPTTPFQHQSLTSPGTVKDTRRSSST